MTPQIANFIQGYLSKSFARLFDEQRRIAQARIYSREAYRTDGTKRSRSGRLMDALRAESYSTWLGSSGLEGRIDYPIYIRFLDMKRLGNHKIYNRPIWGILWSQTLKDLKYDLKDFLRSIVAEGLESFKQH